MNPDTDSLDYTPAEQETADEKPEEEKEKEKEKTVSARLILTNEQHGHIVPCCLKMEVGTLSGTAEFSEEEAVEELQHPPEFKEVQAKFSFTEDQESDLLEAFNLLDYTGEGKMKAEDFRVAIKALGYEPTKEELQKMINAVDKGNTGRLSFENFETAIMRKIMSQDNDGDIMKSFRLFDIDDTGLISFDNLKKVSQILGWYMTDEEIDEMIDDADKDFDTSVNVQEFMKLIKNCVNIVTP